MRPNPLRLLILGYAAGALAALGAGGGLAVFWLGGAVCVMGLGLAPGALGRWARGGPADDPAERVDDVEAALARWREDLASDRAEDPARLPRTDRSA